MRRGSVGKIARSQPGPGPSPRGHPRLEAQDQVCQSQRRKRRQPNLKLQDHGSTRSSQAHGIDFYGVRGESQEEDKTSSQNIMAQKKRIAELHASKPRRQPPARPKRPPSTKAGRNRTELQTPRGTRPGMPKPKPKATKPKATKPKPRRDPRRPGYTASDLQNDLFILLSGRKPGGR